MKKNLEEIKSERGDTIAIIIRRDYGEEGINFVSEPGNPFQLGVLKHQAGYVVKPHIHNKILKKNKENQEFIFVVSGEVEADLYDNERLIKTITLYEGDALLQTSGGHGFRVKKLSKLIEIKQGPFYGTEKEKTYIG
ncbi:hypothetical protein COX24_01435 [bacterium (Candidatus Gribaldobacteria) CG23_combo_of_CG06-09_8_20_14_all_37_87_8]|uniref:Cupin 2 conserved barrel domain-containing protein n=2 Tax=Bacteria candidate phyla TaxID=1783234 RepID=A0A2H0TLU8_9BACT|nr:MAG: hypothetical protein COX24_01435 [bacterium (Candidatus Gribaldobacteria) CG23_combo_of_CG06-09_8_20_14_all_37_87_8]PIR73142.1 MAG: hypothetical protein COV26_00120 [Candidatus Nealsonbacteria bacterium CG10_big_fil_rev_8_21_14_0_10_36_23]